MVNSTLLSRMKSGFQRLVTPAKRTQQEVGQWPYGPVSALAAPVQSNVVDIQSGYSPVVKDTAFSTLERLPIAVQMDPIIIVKRPPLLQVIRFEGDGELNGFKTKVYLNRTEQMFKSLRKIRKVKFTAQEVQGISGLTVNITGLISQLILRGYIERTGEKRPSKHYTGQAGRPTYSEREHLEYQIVPGTRYEAVKRGWGSVVGL